MIIFELFISMDKHDEFSWRYDHFCWKIFGTIEEFEDHFEIFIRQYYFRIPFHKLYEGNLALDHGQVLPNTSSCSSTETTVSKLREIITLTFPSLRSKLFWVFEILLRVVICNSDKINDGSFSYWKPIQIIIYAGPACKDMGPWSMASCSFLLKHFDVLEIFKILVIVVAIFHILIDLFSDLRLNFGISRNLIDHHLRKIRSGVSTCRKKCIELLEYFLLTLNHFLICISSGSSCHKNGLD